MKVWAGLGALSLGIALDVSAQGTTGCADASGKGYSLAHMVNRDTGFAIESPGVGDKVVLRTVDGGATWNPTAKLASGTLLSIHFPDPDTGYIAGGYELWKTVDGGATWAKAQASRIGVGFSLRFTDPRTGFLTGYVSAVPAPGLIQKTADGGATWATQLTVKPILYGMDHPSADTAYVAGSGGHLYRTFDGGAHWDSIQAGATNLYAVKFLSGRHGFVAGEGGALLRTEDGGATWARIDLGTAVRFTSLQFPDPLTGYLLNGNQFFSDPGPAQLVKTADGGATWTAIALPQGYSMASISFSDASHGIAAGSFPSAGSSLANGLMRTSDGGLSWQPGCIKAPQVSLRRPEGNGADPAGFSARAEAGRIVYRLDRPAQVQGTVLDSKGRRLGLIFSGYGEKGLHVYPWSSRSGQGGVILELRAGPERALLKLR